MSNLFLSSENSWASFYDKQMACFKADGENVASKNLKRLNKYRIDNSFIDLLSQKNIVDLCKKPERALEALFENVKLEGGGGSGQVYSFSLKGKRFAVKVQNIKTDITPDWKIGRDFDHPNLLKFYCILDSPSKDTKLLVMELVDGKTVSKRWLISPKERLELTSQAVETLRYLCDKSILAGNIATNNMMVSKEGVFKLIDYGEYYNQGAAFHPYNTLWNVLDISKLILGYQSKEYGAISEVIAKYQDSEVSKADCHRCLNEIQEVIEELAHNLSFCSRILGIL